MRTVITILIVDVVLVFVLFLAWSDMLRPFLYTLAGLWVAGWMIAAYVYLLPSDPSIPMSLVCFGVAMASLGLVGFLSRERKRKYPIGMLIDANGKSIWERR